MTCIRTILNERGKALHRVTLVAIRKLSLDKWPNIKAYVDRVAARPKVQEAMKAEGLIQ
jgi:glutathione S-transferase